MDRSIRVFTKENNLTLAKNYAYGIYNAYFISINNTILKDTKYTKILLPIYCKNEETLTLLNNFLDSIKNKIIKQAYYEKHLIKLMLTKPIRRIKVIEIKNTLDKVIDFCKLNDISSSCSKCGISEYSNILMVNNDILTYCNNCAIEVYNDAEKSRVEYDKIPDHYILGLIGVILGCMLGSIIWLTIGTLGVASCVAGYTITFFSYKFFRMLKGKPTKIIGIIILIISFLTIIIAEYFTCYNFYKELYDYFVSLKVYSSFFDFFIHTPDILIYFIKNIALGILFAILGSYRMLLESFYGILNSKTIVKEVDNK